MAQFFPSVGYPRVYGLFRAMGYAEPVADDLTGLCTVVTPHDLLRQHGLDPRLSSRHLPQGAPTSPALANLCLFRLDRRLHGLARSLGAAYTRYADDLTFSGEAWIARTLATAVPAIVSAEGFALNSAKTRFQPAHHRQITTGIAVNAHVNLPRPAYDRLKAAIHQLPVPPDPREAQILAGRVAWALSLNPKRGEKLAQALAVKLSPPG